MIPTAYKDKTLFVTGSTGFLGKVVLEKLLFVCRDVRKIYLLVRPKADKTASERVAELFSSQCFDRLREEYNPDRDEDLNDAFWNTKVFPIQGDITEDKLGLTQEHYSQLAYEVDVVINIAASSDFKMRLDLSMKSNVIGTMNVFDFAKQCSHLAAFCQVSTCYVSANLPEGNIVEEVQPPPKGVDLEMLVESIIKLDQHQIVKKEREIIGNHPNTYMFTKNIAEQLLQLKRGDIPLTIVRPSVLGVAYRDPNPGWVDSITAGTAVYLLVGLGIIKEFNFNSSLIGDNVPVDYCSDLIIASTAEIMHQDKLKVYHCSISSRNAISWGTARDISLSVLSRNPYQRRISEPKYDMIRSPALFKILFLKREIPTYFYYYLSKMIGNPKMNKNASKMMKLLKTIKERQVAFKDTINKEWIFESYNSFQLNATLSQEDQLCFQLDTIGIDWKLYIKLFWYGMSKYILHEESELPITGRRNFLRVSDTPKSLFPDLMYVFKHGQDQHTLSHKAITKEVLASDQVQRVVRQLVADELTTSALSEAKLLKVQHEKGVAIMDRMATQLSFNKMRMLGYVIHKAFKNMYENVVVDEKDMEQLKLLNERDDCNVVYCPTHRSYVDFIILSYVLYAHEIKVPHICAGEDFLNIAIVHTFLRNSGAFFMRRTFRGDPLYKAIFTEYVQNLMRSGHSLEFFLEGTRARGGKMISPKFGLLNVLSNSYFDGKVQDLYFVPITLNYSRVLEGETFPLELLGESKVKESLGRIINAARYIYMNFGSIYVEVAKPVSFKEYAQEMIVKEGLQPTVNKSDIKLITSSLGWHLIRTMSEKVVVMPTAICASILLMHRKGINSKELTRQVDFLIKLLRKRHILLTAHSNNAETCVKKGTDHLNETVSRKKDIFEPRVTPKVDYQNILLLAYYRNNLVHIFINEALISCSLFGFGQEIAWNEGVTREHLWEKVQFISNLLRNEFVLTNNFKTFEDYNKVLDFMIKEKTISKLENENLVICSTGENHINFLNSLIWPFIDTYWITFSFFYSLFPSKFISEGEMMPQIQAFASNLYEEGFISFYESLSQEVIKNAVGTFQADRVIVKQKLEMTIDGVKTESVFTMGDEFNEEERMQEMFKVIQHFRKRTLGETLDIQMVAKMSRKGLEQAKI
ncbi:unnamed protein product [Moneuplotes crassus]|uniref:Phospholipid/glycerol acyltransferase domain-containing protein n=1 Tax=Euplotes crassus TaxID=5936 RepID=A0AAD1XFJ2_EUPCR|nr:unnamed protein product [Moneuplotes crassus]